MAQDADFNSSGSSLPILENDDRKSMAKVKKAVVFDGEGTLVDNIPLPRKARLLLLRKYGILMGEGQFPIRNHCPIEEMITRLFVIDVNPKTHEERAREKELLYRNSYRPVKEADGLIGFLMLLSYNYIKLGLPTMGDKATIDFTLSAQGIWWLKYLPYPSR